MVSIVVLFHCIQMDVSGRSGTLLNEMLHRLLLKKGQDHQYKLFTLDISSDQVHLKSEEYFGKAPSHF